MSERSEDWATAAVEMSRLLGEPVTAEQLQDVEWSIRQLARMGYALQVTTITRTSYLAKVARIGRMTETHPVVLETLAGIDENGGVVFTYQLEGSGYVSLGAHNSPLCETVQQTVAVALFNQARILKGE